MKAASPENAAGGDVAAVVTLLPPEVVYAQTPSPTTTTTTPAAAVQGRRSLEEPAMLRGTRKRKGSFPEHILSTMFFSKKTSGDAAAATSELSGAPPPPPPPMPPAQHTPSCYLHAPSVQCIASSITSARIADAATENRRSPSRVDRFRRLLDEPIVNIVQLRALCWKGIPPEVRPGAWKLLLGYTPANSEYREETLVRKRREYHEQVVTMWNSSDWSTEERGLLRQIRLDLPRTWPNTPVFHEPMVVKILERVLFLWASRHAAAGYVQGINDVSTPLLLVLLSEHFHFSYVDLHHLEQVRLLNATDQIWYTVEADFYWCMCKLLGGIQDNYLFSQSGVQQALEKMNKLVLEVDGVCLKCSD
eukprot:TRINITY_DN5205_c0_g1_i7.p1 TRINITY_DN5205_c0_g1~~TRINITY_DN5205_c0_g1_i7.p1  ORF type:complete len:396 (+),score=104.93 TRINITY_DN5205_c0_g1_i7:104-1189(+)